MYFILVFTVVISVFPVLWVLLSSFKTNSEILSGAFTLPSNPSPRLSSLFDQSLA